MSLHHLFLRLIGWGRLLYFRLLHRFGGIELVAHRLRYSSDPLSILRYFGAHIGEGSVVYPGIVIHAARENFANLHLGANCRLMRDCFLDLTDSIELQDFAIVGIRASLITHFAAQRGSPARETVVRTRQGGIVLEVGAIVCANATILHGVRIGRFSIVGAGAVVSRDLSAGVTCMPGHLRSYEHGVPALGFPERVSQVAHH